jgi:hypothetical protein
MLIGSFKIVRARAISHRYKSRRLACYLPVRGARK